ncbi:MAG: hypothetical protein IPM74_04900 [Crocinitomicaceae bacterium]|nr:hypothetical protein [Crocinitomicaceae bacterium]MBK8925244.1 hypothetical protein [Crocinitomicaceae bacterium]
MSGLKKIFIALIFTGFGLLVNAMPGPATSGPPGGAAPAGSPAGGGPPCWSPPCIPIDGGIGILLAAGAVIGARKLYKGMH